MIEVLVAVYAIPVSATRETKGRNGERNVFWNNLLKTSALADNSLLIFPDSGLCMARWVLSFILFAKSKSQGLFLLLR